MNKKIVGFAIIAVTLVSLGIWEFWGRENIYYQSVLVLKEDLPANTIVREENFKTKRLESPSDHAIKPKDKEKLIGMETSHYVAAGTELRSEYFSQSVFAVSKGSKQAIISLPTEWLLSYPQTLRRGDTITLYNSKVKVLEAVIIHAKDSSSQEVLSLDNDRLNASALVSTIEIIGPVEDVVEVSRMAREGNRFTLICTR